MSTLHCTAPQVKSLTLLLQAGRLPLPMMAKVVELAQRYDLGVYFSTAQNLRLVGVKDDDFDAVKAELIAMGADLKAPGKFPIPKVCIGKPSCNMGVVDPAELSAKIKELFGARTGVKPKFKIAISACILNCSGAMLADMGIIASRNGYDFYVGGKGGPYPKVGRRVLRDVGEDEILDAMKKMVDYHDAKTAKKQRMAKLLEEPDFPFSFVE